MRMAEIYYASMLDADETTRREGTGTEAGFQSIAQQLTAAGVEFETPFSIGPLPEVGLSAREVHKRAQHLAWEFSTVADALARGDPRRSPQPASLQTQSALGLPLEPVGG